MKRLLLKTMLLLCALVVGSSSLWAESYTITFANNASSATAISTSTGATTTVASASRSYVLATPYSDIDGNCYYGGGTTGEKSSIRLGKSGNGASLSINLSDDGKVKATSIVVNCMRMSGSKNTTATLQVNGMTAQSAPASADDLTFTFASSTSITKLDLVSTKATFIYSITVNYSTSTKKTADLSFAIPSYKVVPSTLFSQTVTNPNNLSVSYTSSDDDIATVDEATGEILTGDKIGTATITASSVATSEYEAGSASYTITTINPNAKGTENNPYNVTEALEEIEILGSSSSEKVFVKGIISTVGALQSGGKLRYYISVDGSTSNQLYVFNGLGFDGNTFSAASDIAVGDEVVIAGTLTKYQNTTPEINQGSSIVQYKHGTTEVKYTNITADKYKTFVATSNLVVPSGVKAYIATGETESELTLTSVPKIKQGTPVILFSETAKSYSFEITTDEVTYPATNLLQISDGTVTNGVFVLAKINDQVGFYKWAGGALSLGKVYVEAPSSTAREFLGFEVENDVTGINEVKGEKKVVDGIFDLQGRKVVTPSKGLYIMNGKKVVIK